MCRRISVAMMVALLFLAGAAFAEGLQTLIEAGKSMGEIQKALNDETESYEQVKQAAASGSLKKGMTRDEVVTQYGEPVIASKDSTKNRDKLIYMPATSSAFEGPKIYLYFDSNNILDEIVVKQ